MNDIPALKAHYSALGSGVARDVVSLCDEATWLREHCTYLAKRINYLDSELYKESCAVIEKYRTVLKEARTMIAMATETLTTPEPAGLGEKDLEAREKWLADHKAALAALVKWCEVPR